MCNPRMGQNSEHVFVLAASNLPWDLDPALLRRLEKRIYVKLPDKAARKVMLETNFARHFSSLSPPCASENSIDFEYVASETEGFSGADIKLLCKEAAMQPVRRILAEMERMELTHQHMAERNTAATRSEPNIAMLLKKHPITTKDMEQSLRCTRRSTGGDHCSRYARWMEEFGST